MWGESCFPQEEAKSLSHYAENTCFTLRGTRPQAARAESQQRALLGVSGLNRAQYSAHLRSPHARPVPAAGTVMQGSVRVRVPAVMVELHYVHTGIIFTKEEHISWVHNYSFLRWSRKEGNGGWSQGDERQTSCDCPCAGWGLPALHPAFLLPSPSHKQ